MLQGLLRLEVLLVEEIVEDVLVTLDQTLRVLLPMLQLLVAVTLDSLEQSCQRELLGVSQLCFLLLKDALHL